MVELSRKEIIRLFKLASLGKLIGGLVHNLNGPLQNLGLDMELAGYALKDSPDLDNEGVKNIRARLKRMEEEFEQIDRLIKTASVKAGQNEDDGSNNRIDINDYLQQELWFLQTDLYFKHNVQKELTFQDNPPLNFNPTRDSLIALSWFLQSLIEELEGEGVKGLTLKTVFEDLSLMIIINTKEGNPSERFMKLLKQDLSSSERIRDEDSDMGIFLALLIFDAEGIAIEADLEPSGSRITITFPIPDKEDQTNRAMSSF
ncbi:MAG: hypothetical protein JW944_01255 [Deltaproteobacteria bacterium]|nr:hypothetical protein [Deltaproteobacteria bacterium]